LREAATSPIQGLLHNDRHVIEARIDEYQAKAVKVAAK